MKTFIQGAICHRCGQVIVGGNGAKVIKGGWYVHADPCHPPCGKCGAMTHSTAMHIGKQGAGK